MSPSRRKRQILFLFVYLFLFIFLFEFFISQNTNIYKCHPFGTVVRHIYASWLKKV